MQTDDFETLLDRYLGGEATVADIAALEKLLHDDSAKRRRLVERVLLEVQLRKACTSILPVAAPVRVPARNLRRLGIGVAAAAVILLAAAALLWFSFHRPEPAEPALLAGSVSNGEPANVRIVVGKSFEVLGDKAAVIRLSDGSRAELDPASKATIQALDGQGRQIVKLEQGGGTFQVPTGEGRFRVETPAGVVTTLGTEFSVKLQPHKKIKPASTARPTLTVSVIVGKVRVETGTTHCILAAGAERVFGDDDGQVNQKNGQNNNHDDGEQHNHNGNKKKTRR